MNDETDHEETPSLDPEAWDKTVKALDLHLVQSIEDRARMDALEIFLLALAEKVGFSRRTVADLLRRTQATCHQARLEQIELAQGSDLAASADRRASVELVDWNFLQALEDAADSETDDEV